MLKTLVCRIAGHSINRRRVWNDSVNFRTTCARCGRELLRDNYVWRIYEPARDDSGLRDTHPRERADPPL